MISTFMLPLNQKAMNDLHKQNHRQINIQIGKYTSGNQRLGSH